MESLINENSLLFQGVENINPTTSSYERIYQYDLPEVFENASKLTAIEVDSEIDRNQKENMQQLHNENAQLMFENLNSPNELILSRNSLQLEDKNRDKEELRLLLRSWNQEELVDHLLSENVVIKILKIIKQHHIEKLLKPFDLGTQILFEDNLEKWRNSLNLPLPTPNMNFSNLSRSSSPSLSTESVPSTSRSLRFSPYRRENERSPTPTETNITLSTILNETSKGIMLVEYYNKHGKFEDEQRSLLVNTCAHFFEENNIKMSLAASYRLEEEILERFPTEKLVRFFKN